MTFDPKDLLTPDDGSVAIPNIETIMFTHEGCKSPVPTPIGHFTDEVIEAIAKATLQNIMSNVSKQRGN